MITYIVIGAVVYAFIGAALHGIMFGQKGTMVTLIWYVLMWPLILTSLVTSSIKRRLW